MCPFIFIVRFLTGLNQFCKSMCINCVQKSLLCLSLCSSFISYLFSPCAITPHISPFALTMFLLSCSGWWCASRVYLSRAGGFLWCCQITCCAISLFKHNHNVSREVTWSVALFRFDCQSYNFCTTTAL